MQPPQPNISEDTTLFVVCAPHVLEGIVLENCSRRCDILRVVVKIYGMPPSLLLCVSYVVQLLHFSSSLSDFCSVELRLPNSIELQ